MLASNKMARRVELVHQLGEIDRGLELALSMPGTNRVTAAARKLLAARRSITTEMYTVGYQPWKLPIDIEEVKAL